MEKCGADNLDSSLRFYGLGQKTCSEWQNYSLSITLDTVYENDEALARRVRGKFTRRCHTKDDVTVTWRAAVSYEVTACHPDAKQLVARDLREQL